jgi:hypothetical protein
LFSQGSDVRPDLSLDLHQEKFEAKLFLSILVITRGENHLKNMLMRWLSPDNRQPAPASDIARGLIKECVEKDEVVTPKHFSVPVTLRPAFMKKARLYRQAMGLLVLLNLTRRRAEYGPVLHEYEGLILPATPTPEGHKTLEKLKTAMADVAELLDPNSQGLSWSQRWFRDIGMNECDPVDLTLFSSAWMSLSVTMNKGIETFRPQ